MTHVKRPASPGQEQEATPFTVMAVSPDPTQRKLLSMALHLEWACEVLTCENVQVAEQRITTQTIHLVLLDALDRENAVLQIIERLRQCSGRSELPVLVLNAETAFQSKFLVCFTRSWKMAPFYTAIRHLLGNAA